VKRLADQTLYEILEVPPDAPLATVKAAIERAREIFGPGSLAMYSLMSPDEASLMNRRIEEAWTTLLDPEARARYDAGLGGLGPGASATHAGASWTLPPVIPARAEAPSTTPAPGENGARAEATATPGPAPVPEVPGASPSRAPLQLVTPRPTPPPAPTRTDPSPSPPAAVRPPIRLDRPVSIPQAAMTPPPAGPAEPPAAPDFGDDAVWTGEMLRRVREARGIPVQIVAERTKVTRHHLENIEADRFALLPAPVYLRGIVLALARELRLDGQKVARSYLERVTAALSPPPPPPGPKR
jgi:hypothetical protein